MMERKPPTREQLMIEIRAVAQWAALALEKGNLKEAYAYLDDIAFNVEQLRLSIRQELPPTEKRP